MGRTKPLSAPLDQYPFVNVFKLPSFDTDRKLVVQGNARQLTDPALHRRVWHLQGNLPSNNCLKFPCKGDALALRGRFVYLFLRGYQGKGCFVYLDCVTESGPVVRVSLSNRFTEVGVQPTQLKLPFPDITRWSVVALDMETIFATYYTMQHYRHLKSLSVCATLSIRSILVSSLIYSPETLPYEAAYPLDKSVAPAGGGPFGWTDLYSFTWVGTEEPGPDDPAPRAPRMLVEEGRKKSYSEYANATVHSPGGGTSHVGGRGSSCRPHVSSPGSALTVSPGVVLGSGGGGAVSPQRGVGGGGGVVELSRTLHVSPGVPLLFTRGKTVMYASGKLVVCHGIDTHEQTHLSGHTSAVTGLFSDYNRKVLGSTQNTPPTLCLWDLSAMRKPRAPDRSVISESAVGSASLAGGGGVSGQGVLRSCVDLSSMVSEICHASVSDNGKSVFVCGRPAKAEGGVVISPLMQEASVYSATPLNATHITASPPFVHHSHATQPACKNKKNNMCYLLVDVSNLGKPSVSLKQLVENTVSVAAFVPQETDKLVTCDGSPTLRYLRVKDRSFRSCSVTAGNLKVGQSGGHSFHFTSVSFEPSHASLLPGQSVLLYAATKEGFVVVFDYDKVNAPPLFTLSVHSGALRHVKPCGGLCATGGDDGFLRVWSSDFSKMHLELSTGHPVLQMDVSRDGLFMAVLNKDLSLSVLDFQTRECSPLLHAHSHQITAAGFHRSPERNLLATASADGSIRVWDTASMTCIAKYNAPDLPGRPDAAAPPRHYFEASRPGGEEFSPASASPALGGGTLLGASNIIGEGEATPSPPPGEARLRNAALLDDVDDPHRSVSPVSASTPTPSALHARLGDEGSSQQPSRLAGVYSSLEVLLGGGVGPSGSEDRRRQKGVAPMVTAAAPPKAVPLMTSLGSSGILGGAPCPPQSASAGKRDPLPLCLDWSYDLNSGSLAVGYTQGLIRAYDVDHRCELLARKVHLSDVESVRYSRNQKWLISVDIYQICFSDVRHGYHTSRVVRFMSPINNPAQLAESGDGRYLAVVGCDDTTIQLYETEQGCEVGVIRDFSEGLSASAGCLTSIAFCDIPGDFAANFAWGTSSSTSASASACGSPQATAPQGFTVIIAGTTEGDLTVYRLPDSIPGPPLPEDIDFGVPAPRLAVRRVSSTKCPAAVRSIEVSPQGAWLLCGIEGATDDARALTGGFFVAPVAGGGGGGGGGLHPTALSSAASASFLSPARGGAWGVGAAKSFHFDHASEISRCVWSPDGASLVTCDVRGAIHSYGFYADRFNPGFSMAESLSFSPFSPSGGPRGHHGKGGGGASAAKTIHSTVTSPVSHPAASPLPATPAADAAAASPVGVPAVAAAEAAAPPRPLPDPCGRFPLERLGCCGMEDASAHTVDTAAEGIVPSGVLSQNSSSIDAVGCTRSGGVITVCGGVISVADPPVAHPGDEGSGVEPSQSLRLLLNDGFVSVISASPCRTLLAAGLVATNGSGGSAQPACRVAVWDLQSYSCLVSAPLAARAAGAIHDMAWCVERQRLDRTSHPQAGPAPAAADGSLHGDRSGTRSHRGAGMSGDDSFVSLSEGCLLCLTPAELHIFRYAFQAESLGLGGGGGAALQFSVKFSLTPVLHEPVLRDEHLLRSAGVGGMMRASGCRAFFATVSTRGLAAYYAEKPRGVAKHGFGSPTPRQTFEVKRNFTECLGLQCVAEADPRSTRNPDGLVWTGGRDGSVNAFLVGTSHAPKLQYSSLLFEHENPGAVLFSDYSVSSIASCSDLLFVCLHPALASSDTDARKAEASILIRIARVRISEDPHPRGGGAGYAGSSSASSVVASPGPPLPVNQHVSLEIISQVNNASGNPLNSVTRCKPVVVQSKLDVFDDDTFKPVPDVITLAVALDNGDIISLRCDDSARARVGNTTSPLVSPLRMTDAQRRIGPPGGDASTVLAPQEGVMCSVDFVKQNCRFPRGSRVSFVRVGYLGEMVAVASRTKVGIWDADSSIFITSGEARAPINDMQFHENIGVITAEEDGCVGVLGYSQQTRSLGEKHRFKLSGPPLQSIALLSKFTEVQRMDPGEAGLNSSSSSAQGLSSVSKVLVADRNGGVYALNARKLSSASLVTESVADRDHQQTLLRTAYARGDIFLHVSMGFSTFSVLQSDGYSADEEDDFSVVCSYSPKEEFYDAQLTTSGEHVVYLQPRSLVVYDWAGRKNLRSIQLHARFTHFLLTPDMVFAVLWRKDSPRIALCDYDYKVVQDIDGHVTPIADCSLSRSGKSIVSLSGACFDYEVLKWSIRQMIP